MSASFDLGAQKHKIALRGASRAAVTTTDILEHAREQRLKRLQTREQPKAALCIQRVWRGCISRAAARDALRSEWIRRYGALAARPDASLDPLSDVCNVMLPLVLAIYNVGPTKEALYQGAPVSLSSREDTVCLRGSLYLLLRSLKATDNAGLLHLSARQTNNATSSDTEANVGNAPKRSVELTVPALLSSRLRRISLLCAASIGSRDVDALTQAAAARMLLHLTSASVWPDGSHDVGFAGLAEWLANMPALSIATRRLLMQLNEEPDKGGRQGSGSPLRRHQTAAASNVLAAMANLVNLDGNSEIMDGKMEHGMQSIARAASQALVFRVFTAPQAFKYFTPSTRDALAENESFRLLVESAMSAAAHNFCGIKGQQQGSHPRTEASTPELFLTEKLRVLVCFGHLLAHAPSVTVSPPASLPTTTKLSHSRQQKQQQAQNQQQQQLFVQAVDAMLSTDLQPSALPVSLHPSATTPQHDAASLASALEAATAVFGEGTIAASLLGNTSSLTAFCRLYASLVQVSDALAQTSATMRLLGGLAFATGFSNRLWQWLTVTVGLPREVPQEATRFDVPFLPLGFASVPTEAVVPFALFCRVHALYLTVALDVEFYDEQTVLSIAEHRALAVSLNALVFRTHIIGAAATPATPRGGVRTSLVTNRTKPSGPGSREVAPAPAACVDDLLKHASRLLRALHERDARRAFCRPDMWLSCYEASTGLVDLSGSAVLNALLRSQAQEEEENERNGLQSRRNDDTDSDEDDAPNLQQAKVVESAACARGRSVARPYRPRRGLAALLLDAPHCIPFENRVEVFRGLIAADKKARKLDRAPLEGGPQPTRIVIRRSRVLEDALAALIPSGTPLPALRSRLSVSFVDLHGNTEVGIDMGGLTKELLESVVAAAFDPNRGLFAVTQSGGECYPHPTACSQPYGPELLTLAGAVIGRAMFDGVLLHAPLAPFFVARLQGRLPTLDDLATLDQEVWRSLVAIKRFQGDAEDLQLDFTVESDLFGAKQLHELIPHGSDISVTSANKLQYCHLVADWHLRRRLSAAAAAFGRGLAAVLPPAWLRLFSPREINMLLGGGEAANVDVNDMIKHTQYAGGYTSLSGTIKNFWKVVKGLDRADQSALLRFVTGVGRAPLGGFGYMNPPLTIHKLSCDAGPLALFGGRDVDRLPSASTCANTLKLPNYRRESTLREKLLCAIRSGAGFDLS